jgi:hypothetical protein
MSARITTLLDGIVTKINAATLSQSVTAVRKFIVHYSTEDAKAYKVVVTDAGYDLAHEIRGKLTYLDRARVTVLFRVGEAAAAGQDDDLVDACLLLVEEITEALAEEDVGSFEALGPIQPGDGGEAEKNHYYPGNLEGNVFAASVMFQYRYTKTLATGGS